MFGIPDAVFTSLLTSLILGLGWLVRFCISAKKEDRRLEEQRKAEAARLEKEDLERRRLTFREAFLMADNDIDSRIAAWRDYKRLGGDNFDAYLEKLQAEKAAGATG